MAAVVFSTPSPDVDSCWTVDSGRDVTRVLILIGCVYEPASMCPPLIAGTPSDLKRWFKVTAGTSGMDGPQRRASVKTGHRVYAGSSCTSIEI